MAPTEKENASARLLIFGSDASSRQALLERMGAWDFNVVVASSSTKVFHRMHEHVPDGVVCMWPMRATHGGLDLLASLRSFDERMMIVVTGFEGDVTLMHEVLQAGADICWPRTYNMDALAVHLQVGIRRRLTVAVSKLRAGDLVVDVRGHQAWRGEVQLLLTPIEFRLLVSLVKRPGEVVSKRTLLEECWRREDDQRHSGDHLVEVHVAALRKKLHACGLPILQTVHSLGYVLRADYPGLSGHSS